MKSISYFNFFFPLKHCNYFYYDVIYKYKFVIFYQYIQLLVVNTFKIMISVLMILQFNPYLLIPVRLSEYWLLTDDINACIYNTPWEGSTR